MEYRCRKNQGWLITVNTHFLPSGRAPMSMWMATDCSSLLCWRASKWHSLPALNGAPIFGSVPTLLELKKQQINSRGERFRVSGRMGPLSWYLQMSELLVMQDKRVAWFRASSVQFFFFFLIAPKSNLNCSKMVLTDTAEFYLKLLIIRKQWKFKEK